MNFNKNNPCPICGKTDYCGWVKSQNGILIGCHRDQNVALNGTISGYDGNNYVLVRIKNDVYVYEEENQLKKARLEYAQRCNGIMNKKAEISQNEEKVLTKKEENLYKIADEEILNDVYAEFLNLNPLKTKHTRKLQSEGWTDYMLRNCDFYSSEDHRAKRKDIVEYLATKYDLKNVPGFFMEGGKWTYRLQPGMLIPVRNINKKIVRIMIRPDWNTYQLRKFEEEQKKVPKYISFSSYKDTKETPMVNVLTNGAKATAQIGVYYEDDDMWDKVIITEGYKKAKAINLMIKMPVIALPGASSYSKIFENDKNSFKNVLKNKGTKTLLIAYDADWRTNKDVRTAFDKLVEISKASGFSTKGLMWDIEDGKGLDDLLLNGKLPKVVQL